MIHTVKTSLLHTLKEFMKCRLDNFSVGFILFLRKSQVLQK